MIHLKLQGIRLSILMTFFMLSSCAIKERINIETDTLIDLNIPNYGVSIKYFGDYDIDNSISRKERNRVLKKINVSLGRMINRPRVIYRASTRLPPFFNEYLIRLGDSTFRSIVTDSLADRNTLYFLFKDRMGDTFILVHNWEQDSKQISKVARREFDAITSTITIK